MDIPSAAAQLTLHKLKKLDVHDRKKLDFYCKYGQKDGARIKTSYYCTECGWQSL